MTDTNFPLHAGTDMDDLPRTLRREREARDREARERAASGLEAPAQASYAAQEASYASTDAPYPAVVRRFEVPFLHLVRFYLKAVVAAIPALILLTVILWGFGQLIKIVFPELLQMQIMISFPKS